MRKRLWKKYELVCPHCGSANLRRTGFGALLDLGGDQHSRGGSFFRPTNDVCSSCFTDLHTGKRDAWDAFDFWKNLIGSLFLHVLVGMGIIVFFVFTPIEVMWPGGMGTGGNAISLFGLIGAAFGFGLWWYQSEGGRYLNRRRKAESSKSRPQKRRRK